MKRLAITSCAIFLTLALGSARARTYKCACEADQKATVQALTGHTYRCFDSEIFKSYGSDVSVQEKYLKLKVNKKNLVQNDGDLDFELRPRKGYCLIAVKDVGGDKPIASSSGTTGECDAGDWLTMHNLSLHSKDSKDTKGWTGTFKASPSLFSKSSKEYYGTVYYQAGKDGKRYLAAACLED